MQSQITNIVSTDVRCHGNLGSIWGNEMYPVDICHYLRHRGFVIGPVYLSVNRIIQKLMESFT